MDGLTIGRLDVTQLALRLRESNDRTQALVSPEVPPPFPFEEASRVLDHLRQSTNDKFQWQQEAVGRTVGSVI